MYIKDPYEVKYQHLIEKRENNGLKNLDYSKNIQDVYKNIQEYNPSRKCNISIVFDMIADMISNKNLIQL